jgi:hypothetical protein
MTTLKLWRVLKKVNIVGLENLRAEKHFERNFLTSLFEFTKSVSERRREQAAFFRTGLHLIHRPALIGMIAERVLPPANHMH